MSERTAALKAAPLDPEIPGEAKAPGGPEASLETQEETYAALLARLDGLGVRVELTEDDRLRVRGWNRLDDADREALRLRRDAIVEYLGRRPAPEVATLPAAREDRRGTARGLSAAHLRDIGRQRTLFARAFEDQMTRARRGRA